MTSQSCQHCGDTGAVVATHTPEGVRRLCLFCRGREAEYRAEQQRVAREWMLYVSATRMSDYQMFAE